MDNCHLCNQNIALQINYCLECGLKLCNNCWDKTLGGVLYYNLNNICHTAYHINMKSYKIGEKIPEPKLNEPFKLINPPNRYLNLSLKKDDINTYIYFMSTEEQTDIYITIISNKNYISSFFVNLKANETNNKFSASIYQNNISPTLKISHNISTLKHQNDYNLDIIVNRHDFANIIRENLESLDLIEDIISDFIKEILYYSDKNKNISYTLDIPELDIITNANISHVMKVILYWCEIPKDIKIMSNEEIRINTKEMTKKFKPMIQAKYKTSNYCISISHCKLDYNE